MPSRVIPLEDLKQRSVMFWLPPGGRDNGVWADTWVILAELEAADVAAILACLRRADIGGYAATPTGRRALANPGSQLYVDREQHGRATDVLMHFLRNRDRPQAEYTVGKRVPTPVRPGARHWTLATPLKVVVATVFIAVVLLWVYYIGAQRFPGVHRVPHPTPISGVPGITNVQPIRADGQAPGTPVRAATESAAPVSNTSMITSVSA